VTDATGRPATGITLSAIVKRFSGVSALDGATLVVRAGTVHALLGENGAGKTTLMRVAFGMLRPDSGRILVDDRLMVWRSPADAIAARIGMVHQHYTLVPAMTVAENVELGAGVVGRAGHWRNWRFDKRAAEQRVRKLSSACGLAVEPSALIADLSIGAQQRVETLKALSRDAKILILDEPTAVLAPSEADEFLRWLREFADRGGTVILITHKLREALAIADDVTVLRRGRTVIAASRADVDERSLSRAMIGDEMDPSASRGVLRRRSDATGKQPIVVLDGVTAIDSERREAIRATFAVHAGEIVGVAGVEGGGQHTLLRVLGGRIRPIAGYLLRPQDIAFIPEDRHRDGLILDFTLAENVALRGAGARRGLMSWSTIRQHTAMLIDELDVRASGPTVRARLLSGGNQQRLVLARELAGQPALIIAENPTRGLDVRAMADVHERLRDARDAGTAVVLYSSDLDEVLTLATRVIAVHAGSAREVAAEKDAIGRAILGLP
jgi:general nucleoside transport system ATP-binding protein